PLGDSGLIAWMQLPLNVSPVSASVIGLQRRGILPVLLLACASHSFSHLLTCLILCLHLFFFHSFFSTRSSLLALGKIEVIVIFSAMQLERCGAGSPDNWKVESSLPTVVVAQTRSCLSLVASASGVL